MVCTSPRRSPGLWRMPQACDACHGWQSATALKLGGRRLFHRPRLCRAKVNEALTCEFHGLSPRVGHSGGRSAGARRSRLRRIDAASACPQIGDREEPAGRRARGGASRLDQIPRTRYTLVPAPQELRRRGRRPWARWGKAAGRRCAKPNEPEKPAEINELVIPASAKASHGPRTG
jgi:hypothetical protein